jgi:hypothetical protein
MDDFSSGGRLATVIGQLSDVVSDLERCGDPATGADRGAT